MNRRGDLCTMNKRDHFVDSDSFCLGNGVAGSAGTTAKVKKIRPCVQKTERLSAVLGSAATGNPLL
jgi:hypothetical protein